MEELKKMSAMVALNDMMSKGRFDICTIDSIGAMMNIKPSGEAYTLLRPLHCIYFDKMPTELRDAIPGLIQQVLGISPAYQFKTMDKQVIDVSPPEKKGVLHRLGLA